MKSLAIILVAFSLAVGAACADDLLDSVLDTEPTAPVSQPASSPPTVSQPTQQAAPATVGNAMPEAVSGPALPAPGGSETNSPTGDKEGLHSDRQFVVPNGSWPSRSSTRLSDIVSKFKSLDGMPEWEPESAKNRIMLSGGGGGDRGLFVDGSFEMPLGKMFDILLRGFYVKGEREVEGYYYFSRRHHGWTEDWTSLQVFGVDALLDWNPLRGRFFAPYIGAGACYRKCRSGIAPDTGPEGGGYMDVAGRIGLAINFNERLHLRGEFARSSENLKEIVADLGINLSHSMQVHLIARSEELSGEHGPWYSSYKERFTMFGAGFSYDF